MIKYYEHIEDVQDKNMFIAVIPTGIQNKSELINQLAEKLVFPDYFGHNWDALWDSLCNFEWINEHTIAIIHREIPAFDHCDLILYISILYDSVVDWGRNEAHTLEIYFPIEVKNEIVNLIAEAIKIGEIHYSENKN
jgi:hypothetical protein